MKAVILAAGKGTRMGELTQRLPKPLVPVRGVPAIERVIAGLASQGVKEVVVVIGHLGHMVKDVVGNGSRWGLNIEYVVQTVQEGTARALLLTRTAVAGADVMLTYADVLMSPENYGRLREHFYDNACKAVGGVRNVGDPWRGAAVYLDSESNITRIVEKPPKGTSTTPWNHAGIWLFRNSVFPYLERVQPSPRGEYEVTDVVAEMMEEGSRVRGIELTGYWKDLATPQDVIEAEALFQ